MEGARERSRRHVDIPLQPDPAAALSAAARVALRAPSVHNTQPWHWQVAPDRLRLYGDERWRLPVADPGGRLLLLSCGTALHLVRVALRAMGYLPAVRRLPDTASPQLLATVTVERPIPVTNDAAALLRAALDRQTDRRPFADVPPSQSALTAMRTAAALEGGWLQAGETLSAVWLAALTHGLAMQPISAVIEVPAARAVLHRLLSGIGTPYLAVRVGVTLAGEVAATPRRAAAESISIGSDEDGATRWTPPRP